MKKALITFVILFVISIFVAVVSFAICGGELIAWAVELGIEAFRDYRAENTVNTAMMQLPQLANIFTCLDGAVLI